MTCFRAFKYPRHSVDEGRAWTEASLLHAFLLFNQEFQSCCSMTG